MILHLESQPRKNSQADVLHFGRVGQARFKEGVAINKSLSALANCIFALYKQSQQKPGDKVLPAPDPDIHVAPSPCTAPNQPWFLLPARASCQATRVYLTKYL